METVDQSQGYLNYILFSTDKSKNVVCPQYGSREYTFISGSELSTTSFPSPYAYQLGPQELFQIEFSIVSMSRSNLTLSVIFNFTYSPWSEDLVSVRGALFDVNGCSPSLTFDAYRSIGEYRIYRYVDFYSAFSGTMVFALGHFHRMGQDAYLVDRDTGEIIVNTRAHYDNPNQPQWITRTDSSYPLVKINKFDPLRLVGTFGNEDLSNAMASIMTYFVVTDVYMESTPLKQVTGKTNPFSQSKLDTSSSKRDALIIYGLIASNILTAAFFILLIIGILTYHFRSHFMKPTIIIENETD